MSQTSISQVLRAVTLEDVPRALGRPRALPSVQRLVATAAAGGAKEVPMGQVQDTESTARGFEQGYERGFQEGLTDAAQKIEQATRQAVNAARSEALAALDSERKRMESALAEHVAVTQRVLEQVQRSLAVGLRSIEEQAISLAFDAVCRVVGDSAASFGTVRAVVERALSELAGKPILCVRMRPDDLATLQAGADPQAMFPGFPSIKWVADETIAVGGCVVDTATGTLDARLEVQLRNLGNAWRNSVAELSGGVRDAPGQGQETAS